MVSQVDCIGRGSQYGLWYTARLLDATFLRLAFVALFLSVTLLPIPQAQAVEQVDNLGQVRLWAQTRTAHQRHEVLSAALQRVIVRISGQQSSLSLAPVSQWLRRPADYMVSYVYQQPTRTELNDRELQSQPVDGLWLKLIFDHVALAQAMREMGVPVWGASRPRVVLWWGMDVDAQRYLVGREDDTSQTRAFRRGATDRGIPLVFPKLDVEDQSRVGQAGVFGFAADPILQGSKRYAADAILVGRAKRVGDRRWQASWQLYANSESYWFEETADSAEALAERALMSVAEQLSALYAVTTTFGESGEVGLRIIDVAEYRTYVEIQRYLERLNVVNKVHLSQVRGAQLEYQIFLDGDVTQLKKALSLDGKLVSTGNVPAAWTLPVGVASSNPVGSSGAASGSPVAGVPATGSPAVTNTPIVANTGQVAAVQSQTQLEYYWVGP